MCVFVCLATRFAICSPLILSFFFSLVRISYSLLQGTSILCVCVFVCFTLPSSCFLLPFTFASLLCVFVCLCVWFSDGGYSCIRFSYSIPPTLFFCFVLPFDCLFSPRRSRRAVSAQTRAPAFRPLLRLAGTHLVSLRPVVRDSTRFFVSLLRRRSTRETGRRSPAHRCIQCADNSFVVLPRCVFSWPLLLSFLLRFFCLAPFFPFRLEARVVGCASSPPSSSSEVTSDTSSCEPSTRTNAKKRRPFDTLLRRFRRRCSRVALAERQDASVLLRTLSSTTRSVYATSHPRLPRRCTAARRARERPSSSVEHALYFLSFFLFCSFSCSGEAPLCTVARHTQATHAEEHERKHE